jgi:hypothetical protein
MGAAAPSAFSFGHDVYATELSQFQSHHLANDALFAAFSHYQSRSAFYGPKLRMDAGGFVSWLSSLRILAALGFKTVAA